MTVEILFVCTGNICRSPVAEAVARARFAMDGVRFSSAGTAAWPGAPASREAISTAGEIGIDVGVHRSRQLDAAAIRRAVRVYGLSAEHIAAVMALDPVAGSKTELLDPSGDAVPDPYGRSLDVYRASRDQIVQCVEGRLGEWRALRYAAPEAGASVDVDRQLGEGGP